MKTGNGVGEREVQEASVTPVTTSHHLLGSGFVTAGKENPRVPIYSVLFKEPG